MPVAARSAPRGAQSDARFLAPARWRDSGAAPRGGESGGERPQPLRQAGEAGRRGRWVASSAAPFLPSFSSPPPPPVSSAASSPAAEAAAAASASPSAACLLPAPPRTRARSRCGFPGLAMSGGAARLPPPPALCPPPPPPLHGPSLPEPGARSQGRGSPAGHGAPRTAPGARGPPPGEREGGPAGGGVVRGASPPPGSARHPRGPGSCPPQRPKSRPPRGVRPPLGGEQWYRTEEKLPLAAAERGLPTGRASPGQPRVQGARCASVAGAAMASFLAGWDATLRSAGGQRSLGLGVFASGRRTAASAYPPCTPVCRPSVRPEGLRCAGRRCLLSLAAAAAASYARLWCGVPSAAAGPGRPCPHSLLPAAAPGPQLLPSGFAGRPLCRAPERSCGGRDVCVSVSLNQALPLGSGLPVAVGIHGLRRHAS